MSDDFLIHRLAADAIKRVGKPHFYFPKRPGLPKKRPPMLNLAHNLNAFDLPYRQYPPLSVDGLMQRYGEFISTLAQHKGQTILQPTSDEICITQGISEGIAKVIETFCNPGDTVGAFEPSFPLYRYAAEVQGMNYHAIDVFTPGHVDLPPSLSNCKVLFLCSPNNPTGNVLPADQLQGYFKQYPDTLFVIDEAYIEFSDTTSLVELIPQYDNLLVLRTLSKAWGLAGMRIGFCISNSALINSIKITKLPFDTPSFVIENLENELADFQKVLGYIDATIALRTNLSTALKKMPSVKHVFESHTNFIMTEFHDAKDAIELLRNNRIMVGDQTRTFHNCLRISVGNEAANKQLTNALSQLEPCVIE